ncbi:MAG: twitching motility protein PilT [Bacteroidales bacterium]|nr:twitching motility protein PilT [Bacteroidales bacterium]MCM1414449.1 twitching motility protein PilT [bacterium]MCM1422328.1 twitching motility protein PilT [bacterium]
MVQFIVGKEGKGKTKQLLDRVNAEIKDAQGNFVYLDKSTKHMFELNNKIRLIDVPEYLVTDSDEFIGFICGIISQDHDLQKMYFDSFLKIACMKEDELEQVVAKIEKISGKFNVDFVISLSRDESELPESIRKNIVVSL